MKTKYWVVGIALLALVLGGAAMLAFAQQSDENRGSGGWGGDRHGHMGYMARELSLTDQQKQQIKTILQSNRTTLRPVMMQLGENRKAMLAATAGGAFDQAKVQALANQQAQLRAQLTIQKTSIRSQIYNQVLTPDQKAKADQMRVKQMARIDEHLQKLAAGDTESGGAIVQK